MKKDFNEFRFGGLNYRNYSNKYHTMNRISDDEKKIVIKVDDDHLIETKYGYAFILDRTHVVFLKEWQVSRNFFGNEILLDENYFQIKTWGNRENFLEEKEVELNFDKYKEIAKEQKEVAVMWEK